MIVDALMSLAMCTGAIPGLQQHLESAHKVAVASPAQGGGMEAAMAQLRQVGQQPHACVSDNLGDDDGSVRDGGGDSGDSVEATRETTSVGSSAPQPSATNSNGSNSPGLCRSNWRGDVCSDDACTRVHRDYCLLRSCYPLRDPNCLQWHPRSWIAPNMKGNGQRGNGQPSNKAAMTKNKPKIRHPDGVLNREIKLLKQELALHRERSRLEAKKRTKPPRPTSYRDAAASGLSQSQHQRPSLLPTQVTQPLATQVSREGFLHGTSSATVLPPAILAAIQLAVETAFSNRNPH